MAYRCPLSAEASWEKLGKGTFDTIGLAAAAVDKFDLGPLLAKIDKEVDKQVEKAAATTWPN